MGKSRTHVNFFARHGKRAFRAVLFDGIAVIGDALGTSDEAGVLNEVYPHLPRTSVDFGIMESARQCWTIPVDQMSAFPSWENYQ